MAVSFLPKRVIRTYTHEVGASLEKVFPQLCPTREYDWIPLWSCDLTYSESGYAELGCVFQRDNPLRGRETWVVCRYDPNRAIAFVILAPDVMTEQLEVLLAPAGTDRSRLTWTRTYTGLSERGNQAVSLIGGEMFDAVHGWLGRALDLYCSTGKVTQEPFPGAHG